MCNTYAAESLRQPPVRTASTAPRAAHLRPPAHVIYDACHCACNEHPNAAVRKHIYCAQIRDVFGHAAIYYACPCMGTSLSDSASMERKLSSSWLCAYRRRRAIECATRAAPGTWRTLWYVLEIWARSGVGANRIRRLRARTIRVRRRRAAASAYIYIYGRARGARTSVM